MTLFSEAALVNLLILTTRFVEDLILKTLCRIYIYIYHDRVQERCISERKHQLPDSPNMVLMFCLTRLVSNPMACFMISTFCRAATILGFVMAEAASWFCALVYWIGDTAQNRRDGKFSNYHTLGGCHRALLLVILIKIGEK